MTATTMIEPIRDVSRRLVREFGFMSDSLAGVDLPPSAVHALLEVEAKGDITAGELSDLLRLEKSSVSRMVRKLLNAGILAEAAGGADGRTKPLSLTAAGRATVATVHAFARRQVTEALGRLAPGEDRTVLEGLRLYAHALGSRGGNAKLPPIDIMAGYRLGLIARIVQMHALYYARTSGFGQRFEVVVAGGLADFCDRMQNPRNAIWTAVQGTEIVGSIAIDGEDLGGNVAHLRWFIIDDSARGGGLGRKLLTTALAFADVERFAETHLWTFSGLSAARHLYEAHGFVCAEERPGAQWGKEVLEQRFERPLPCSN